MTRGLFDPNAVHSKSFTDDLRELIEADPSLRSKAREVILASANGETVDEREEAITSALSDWVGDRERLLRLVSVTRYALSRAAERGLSIDALLEGIATVLQADRLPSGARAADGKQARARAHADAVLAQARLLDGQMAHLAKRHEGKFVVFHDGEVLASGGTAEEALAQIPSDSRPLPFVIRFISTRPDREFMGGPKGE